MVALLEAEVALDSVLVVAEVAAGPGHSSWLQ